jgi:hypothetical protein
MTDVGASPSSPPSGQDTLGIERAFAIQPGARAFGFVNVFEGSSVTITARFKKGGGLFKRNATWHIENVSTGAVEKVEVKISNSATEAQHVIELQKVPPAEANYRIRYKLEIKDQLIPGQAEFVVWPRSIDLKATHAEEAKDKKSYKAGDPAKEFSFKISQMDGGAVDTSPFTDETGWRKNHQLRFTGAFKVLPAGSWEIKEWVKGKEKGRDIEVKVTRKPYDAKIWNLPSGTTDADGKRHKQWINQPHLPAGFQGRFMQVRVGAKEDQHQTDLGLRLGAAGDPIHVQVEFHADNSKATGRGVKLMDLTSVAPESGNANLYKLVVKLGEGGAPADFLVDMGPAGGDRVTIKVGTTDACDNDTVYAETWRRIGVGLAVPDKGIRQSSPTILKDDGAELADGIKAKLKAVLDKLFISLYFPSELAKEFKEADIDDTKGTDYRAGKYTKTKGKYVIIDAAKYANWVKSSAGSWSKVPLSGKLFIPTPEHLDTIRAKVLPKAVYKKDTLDVRWADLLSAHENSQDYDGTEKKNTISGKFADATPQDIDIMNFHVLEFDPVRADGTRSVQKIRWKVLKVRKQGATTWDDPVADGPGFDESDWQEAPCGTKAEADKFITFPDSLSCQLKLPSAAAGDPGKLLTITREEDDGTGTNTKVDVTYETQILLEVLVAGVHFNINGNAFGGYINMSARAGTATDQGSAHVIAHELGHNLGQAYIQNLGTGELHDTPPGTDNRGRKTAIPGLPFGKVVPEGPYFAGKGFAGGHCAYAIKKKVDAALPGDTNAAKRKAIFDEPKWAEDAQAVDDHKQYFKIASKDHCIMYATSSLSEATAMEFCADCVTNIKATDASDIRKDWRAE